MSTVRTMLTLRTENHEWLKQHASTPHGMSALLNDIIQERRLALAHNDYQATLADIQATLACLVSGNLPQVYR